MVQKVEHTTASKAFSNQSAIFDMQYRASIIVHFMRNRVYQVLQKYFPKNASVLELNAGTAEDAVWMAKNGYRVLATDVSPGMIAQQKQKINGLDLQDKVESRLLSFLDLDLLKEQNFDAVFSNFGGLNCTQNLDQVLLKLSEKVKINGIVCLVIMPPNCLWEMTLAVKGNFKLAFRRWKKGGTKAHIEGVYFNTYYYKSKFVKRHLPNFKTLHQEALCLAVPPEYLRHHMEKHPFVFQQLKKIENKIKSWPLFRNFGDYYIVVLQKTY